MHQASSPEVSLLFLRCKSLDLTKVKKKVSKIGANEALARMMSLRIYTSTSHIPSFELPLHLIFNSYTVQPVWLFHLSCLPTVGECNVIQAEGGNNL